MIGGVTYPLGVWLSRSFLLLTHLQFSSTRAIKHNLYGLNRLFLSKARQGTHRRTYNADSRQNNPWPD
jgi:hypothetical protein